MSHEPFVCVLCLHPITEQFGNNPWPLSEKGRCCDDCNQLVILARLARLSPKNMASIKKDLEDSE